MIEKLFSAPLAVLPGYVEETLLPRAANFAVYENARAAFTMSPEKHSAHREMMNGGEVIIKHAAAAGEWLINRDNRRAWLPYNIDSATRIAQINVTGFIGKALSPVDIIYFGGCCLDQVQTAFEHLAEFAPRAVALHFGSPGGETTGVQEMSQFIAEYSASIAPVHAYTDTVCASAAYWLAMGAVSFTASATALIGCIGTLCLVRDTSAAAKQAGITVHRIASGWAKGQGMPGIPVDPAYIEFLQRGVDQNAARFYATVANRRAIAIESQAAAEGANPAKLASDVMQGQYWEAQDAPACLLDGVLPTRRAHLAALQRALTSGK